MLFASCHVNESHAAGPVKWRDRQLTLVRRHSGGAPDGKGRLNCPAVDVEQICTSGTKARAVQGFMLAERLERAIPSLVAESDLGTTSVGRPQIVKRKHASIWYAWRLEY